MLTSDMSILKNVGYKNDSNAVSAIFINASIFTAAARTVNSPPKEVIIVSLQEGRKHNWLDYLVLNYCASGLVRFRFGGTGKIQKSDIQQWYPKAKLRRQKTTIDFKKNDALRLFNN